MEKKTQFNLWYLLAAILGVLLIRDIWVQSQTVQPIPYSQFEQYLEAGEVDELVIGTNTISGRFKTPKDGHSQFMTTRVEPELADRLSEYGVQYTRVVESTFLRDVLSWVIPVLVFFAIWMFLFRRFAERQGLGGFMSIGKSKAKIYVEKDTKTHFDDVAGVNAAPTRCWRRRRWRSRRSGN